MQGAPGPYMRQRCHIDAAHGGSDVRKNGHKLREFLRVFHGWKLRPRRSAQECLPGRVCPRIPCPAPPGQESFGRYCVRPRATSYKRKNPASRFQTQERRGRPAAAPPRCRVLWYISSVKGQERGEKFPLLFPLTRFLTMGTRYHVIPRRR